MKKAALKFAVSGLFFGAMVASAQAASVVQTDAGAVQGGAPDARGVVAFKGIPYAAPPVDALRFRPPQPAAPWNGVRQATAFSAPCWGTTLGPPPDVAAPKQTPPSEDCLALNVWTPPSTEASHRKAVMVWIHGGGFVFGTASTPDYDGANLASHDAVIVTVNYRLGAFGFLAHPALDAEAGTSGNYGLEDMVAALRWVRQNIAAFGGDPENVTIFGESAGAHAIGILMAAPSAQGLFQKAIIESGAWWDSEHGSMPTHEQEVAEGEALAYKFGTQTAAGLRNIPAEQLNTATQWDVTTDPGLTAFTPSVDGQFLPESPGKAFVDGTQPKIPLLGGWNDREDMPIFTPRDLPHATPQEFRAGASQLFGQRWLPVFNALYPSGNEAQATASADELSGDLVIRQQTWEMLARQWLTSRAPVYVYQYSYASPFSPVPSHGSEWPFVFGNLPPTPSATPSDADRAFSDLLASYWTNFAKSGNPNGRGLPNWPAYAGPNSQVMHLQADAGATREYGTLRYGFIAAFRKDGRLPEAWRNVNVNN